MRSKNPILKVPVTKKANKEVKSIGNIKFIYLVISNTIIRLEKVLVIEDIKAAVAQAANIAGSVLIKLNLQIISPYNHPIKQPNTNPGVKIPKGMAAVVKKNNITNLEKILYKIS